MPLTDRTHDETGEHWIVVTPNPEYAGRRLGVTFIDGEGRTRDITKAQEFAEVYNYEVIAYTGAPKWNEAPSTDQALGERPAWSDESVAAPVSEVPLNRPEGTLKPRLVKDEIAEEAAFRKAI